MYEIGALALVATKKHIQFGLVPGYTTLSVRLRANIKFGALKVKRENERTGCLPYCPFGKGPPNINRYLKN